PHVLLPLPQAGRAGVGAGPGAVPRGWTERVAATVCWTDPDAVQAFADAPRTGGEPKIAGVSASADCTDRLTNVLARYYISRHEATYRTTAGDRCQRVVQ